MAMSRRRLCVLFSVGALLLALGGIMIPVVDMVVKDKIKERVIISNTSELWNTWVDPAIPIYMQFYMFNLSNPEEVKQGGKPFVVQKGPYTYRETRKKYDIVFNQNGTVTYRQKRAFFFMRNMSVGADTDIFTTVNPPVLGVIMALKFTSLFLRKAVNDALWLYGEDIFVTRSVHELIWGYRDPVLKTLNRLFPGWFYTDFVGYFINKNNTDNGLYTVFTGSKDMSSLGDIDMYNGSKFLPYWSTKWANMVNGSDGTISPPFSQDSQLLWIFSPDICRSGFAMYQKHVKTKQGISLRRFSGRSSELANTTVNPDNIGFCTPQTQCLPSGLLNVSNCLLVDSFHIPGIVSLPHFFMADPRVQRSVGGLNPNQQEHETTVDVEPWTGLVLQAAKRVQVNMYLTQLPDMNLTRNVRTLFLPVFWINESAVVDEKHAEMLHRELFVPLKISSVLEKVFMVVGGVLILLAMAIAAYENYKKTQQGPVPTIGDADPVLCNQQQDNEEEPLLRDSQDGSVRATPTDPNTERPHSS